MAARKSPVTMGLRARRATAGATRRPAVVARSLLVVGLLGALLTACASFGEDHPPTSAVALGSRQPADQPAAEQTSPLWTSERIDTTTGADYLGETEKAVVLEINRVRTDPAAYAAIYLEPLRRYYRGRLLQYPGEIAIETTEGARALEECIRVLEASPGVATLTPRKGLCLAARDHARDQARSGRTGHTGSDGSTVPDRLNRYGRWSLSAGENIDYGNAAARRIVISFLVDDGVPSRGHRANLLDSSFRFVGVALGPHPAYGKMCVLDFAGAYR